LRNAECDADKGAYLMIRCGRTAAAVGGVASAFSFSEAATADAATRGGGASSAVIAMAAIQDYLLGWLANIFLSRGSRRQVVQRP
jgi:hypothetical protein